MATTEPKDIWTELRKPFDPKAVGQLPKPTKKDNPKGKCAECLGWHGLPAVHLDYVGHAAVTDRLITVDPQWTWEPLAQDEHGLPIYDGGGGLWIKLTVGGVTRLGWGDGETPKERIGDAIRNAAMRFGVALDLWSKDELESNIDNPENKNVKPSESKPAHVSETTAPALQTMITQDQFKELMNLAKLKGYSDKIKAIQFLNEATGLADVTTMPAADFDAMKKRVTSAGWKKPDATPIDLNDIPF